MQRPTQLLQYADDNFLFSARENMEHSMKYFQTNIKNDILSFERHRLNTNTDKPEFMISCKMSQKHIASDRQSKVKNDFIEQSNSAKYSGSYKDQILTYQMEVKNVSRKMATSVKILNSIGNIIPTKTRVLLLNSLVVGQLHYSSI